MFHVKHRRIHTGIAATAAGLAVLAGALLSCGGSGDACRGAGCLDRPGPTAKDVVRDSGPLEQDGGLPSDGASAPGDAHSAAGAACSPGALVCADEQTVARCAPDGSRFVAVQSCDGASTGRICRGGACIPLCAATADFKDSTGCEFWALDLDNAFVPANGGGWYDAQNAPYAIVVSNPHPTWSATVTLTVWDPVAGAPAPLLRDRDGLAFDLSPIGPGELRAFFVGDQDVNGTMVGRRGIRVTSSIPVLAVQFNPLANVDVYSNDASLLLPMSALGQYYLVMTREQAFPNLRGYVSIVAAERTTVSVTVTAPTQPSSDGSIPALEPGGSLQRVLEPFDVWNLETGAVGADLTGTEVRADRPVAVFGGSEAANAPDTNHCVADLSGGPLGAADRVCEYDRAIACEGPEDCWTLITCCADHLEQQLFPVATWGLRYLATRSQPRGGEADSWRILAAEDGTRVTTLPRVARIPVLHRGEWFDFETRQDFEIVADRPVLVGQFLQAQDAPGPGPDPGDAGIGDPAFLLAVPVEQFRADYVFLTPDRYALDYVNIVAPRGATVELDGALLPGGEFEPFGTQEYVVARLAVADGVHRLRASAPVGVAAYGYDRWVSYGYPAGLNLTALRPEP